MWIAILEVTNGIHAVNDLFQVQDLARRLGMSSPFAALVRFLQEGEFTAAGIDAPFSLPKSHMPAEGYRELLKHVSMMECERRPFPSGEGLLSQLIQLSSTELPHPRGRKIYRETEHGWIKQGVNVRSTTWNGPRGGAAFTAAALYLLGQVELPIWPWAANPAALRKTLVETFPAAQLKTWGLPCRGYNGVREDAKRVRQMIVQGIHEQTGVIFSDRIHTRLLDSADALDAVICALSAAALGTSCLESMPSATADVEVGLLCAKKQH